MTVGVAIPSVPPRAGMLVRALQSVTNQTRPVDAISVAIDNGHKGPGITRTQALFGLDTKWVAPLDDDDEFYPHHIQTLMDYVTDSDADVVYPWFDVQGGTDPFPQFFGKPWDDADPHVFGCWFIARRELLLDIGGWLSREEMGDQWKPEWQGDGSGGGEDWNLILRMVAAGAKIEHLPIRTYIWHHGSHHHYSGATW